MSPMQKRENLAWVRSLDTTPAKRRSVWERLTGGKGRDDDDDDHDLPGPNAGATLWPIAAPRKTAAALA